MTYDALTAIVTVGHYIAFFIWTVLAVLIGGKIFKRNFKGLRLLSLYLINSVTFIVAWGLILKLALIVMAPIMQTREKSIEMLRVQADNHFSDFILSSLIFTSILTIINILHLKYIAKTSILKHSLVLFIGNVTILLLASYISTEWYYTGMTQEIYRHFNH